MTLSLIIFDCDGVILESVPAKTRAFAKIGALYGQEAERQLVKYHTLHGGVTRSLKFLWLFKEVLKREPKHGELEDLEEKFTEYSQEEIDVCDVVPGVEDVLKAWKGRVPLYVASGAPHQELITVLEHKGLAHYFTGIYGYPPTKTDLLRKILQETNIDPLETIMIGDSATDQYAAETVHCHFYGRGEYFSQSDYPWHYDLTKLNEYLEQSVG